MEGGKPTYPNTGNGTSNHSVVVVLNGEQYHNKGIEFPKLDLEK